MHDIGSLQKLVARDPELAWPLVVEFIRAHPDLAESEALIEDLVYNYDDQFVDRIEAAARQDPIIREVVEQAYVGGDASVGAERFNDLQERLRDLLR